MKTEPSFPGGARAACYGSYEGGDCREDGSKERRQKQEQLKETGIFTIFNQDLATYMYVNTGTPSVCMYKIYPLLWSKFIQCN